MAFGQEIKDFLTAMQAGEKVMSSMGDREYKRLRAQLLKTQIDKANDPESLNLDKDLKRARINRKNRGPQARPRHPSEVRALDARTDYYQERLRQLKNPPAPPKTYGPADDAVPMYGPSPSTRPKPDKVSALDIEDEVASEQEMAAVDPELMGDPEEEMTQFADKGGVIEDAEDDDVIEDDTDVTDVEDDSDDLELGYSPAAAHDAVKGGLQFAAKATGATGGPAEGIPTDISAQRRTGGVRAYVRGEGAASADEMVAVRRAIDPEGRMSESERNMAALAYVYEWKLRNNDPQGADRAAASMLQYYRQVSDRYKAIASAAAENGDVDGAMKAILKAHANIPDGLDLRLVKRQDGSVAYNFVDAQTNKITEQGVATPEQILAFASRGSMQNFDDVLARAAGARGAVSKAGAEARASARTERVPRARDREAARTAIDGVINPEDPKAKKFKVPDELADPLKQLASQIYHQNDVSPEDAVTIASTLGDPTDTPKVNSKRAGEGYVVTLDGDREIRMSRDAFQNLIVLQRQASKLRDANSKKETETKAREAKRTALVNERLERGQAGVAEAAQQERDVEASLPARDRPLKSYGALGDVRQRALNAPPSAPAPRMSEIERINAARRSAGLPPINQSALPVN